MKSPQLEDALRIWHAGLEAVRSDRLVRDTMVVEGDTLRVGGECIDLRAVRHIEVVGAGKAGAGMAAGLEQALGLRLLAEKSLSGWLNVPADCVRPLSTIHLHAARPAGVNEPRPEGVVGSEEILRRVEALDANDLCIALISGGASALLPAPIEGVSLAEKLALTKHLSGAGANIAELNTVRKQISRIKGGGLLRACRAGRLIALVISDVLGDPLDIIASGPTVLDTGTPAMAMEIIDRYGARAIAPGAVDYLVRAVKARVAQSPGDSPGANDGCRATTMVIGNNATAVDAAAAEARRGGYVVRARSATTLEGQAEEIGRDLADEAIALRGSQATCIISGGEPVVTLAAESERGRGGRNQQLVLAALDRLASEDASGIVILSAGTDGEDGPTDAAGAWMTAEVIAEAKRRGLDWRDSLRRNDAYTFFDSLGALVKTGPTDTNVCDVRVAIVGV